MYDMLYMLIINIEYNYVKIMKGVRVERAITLSLQPIGPSNFHNLT
jgi:hypothetical protein